MKTEDLKRDMTAEGFANRVALRLADRYPVGSVEVKPTADGENIRVTLIAADGKETVKTFDVEELRLLPDPLTVVLPALPEPADVGKGEIKETPTDEAAARAIATDTEIEPGTIMTRPEIEHAGVEGEVTTATTEAVTPEVDGTKMVVTEPNNPEIADAETAKEAAEKQVEDTAGLRTDGETKKAVVTEQEADAVKDEAGKDDADKDGADKAEPVARPRTRAATDADTSKKAK